MTYISRRTFLSDSCRKASCLLFAAIGGTVLSNCDVGTNLIIINVTPVNWVVTLPLDANSPLSQVGDAIAVHYDTGKLVVAHVTQGTFTALAGVCTHEACDISRYETQTKQFLCPCHATYFKAEGSPVWGAARRPLAKYETHIENNQLKIRLQG